MSSTRCLSILFTLTITLGFAACGDSQRSSSRDNATAADAGTVVATSGDAAASSDSTAGDCEAEVAECFDDCGDRGECVAACHVKMELCFGGPDVDGLGPIGFDCDAEFDACSEKAGDKKDQRKACDDEKKVCAEQQEAMKQQEACDEAFFKCTEAEGCLPAEPLSSTDASMTTDASSVHACMEACQTNLDECMRKIS